MLNENLEPTTHRDKLGQILSVGDYVIFGRAIHRDVQIGKITRTMPKMVEVTNVIDYTFRRHYAADTVFIDASRLTFYILANSK